MKFSYQKYPVSYDLAFPKRRFVVRPIIPIRVSYNNKHSNYGALIDSGADICIFHGDFGDYMSIPVPQGIKTNFNGIYEKRLLAYVHTIDITMSGHRLKSVPVAFSYDIPSYGYGIVGQYGFLDKCRITFDTRNEEIEIKLL